MPKDDDEPRSRKKRLQKTGFQEVWRRLLEQDRSREIPVRRPLLEEPPRLLLARLHLGEVRLRREAEASGPAPDLRGWIDGLEVLALVGRHAGVREAADVRVRREQ